MELGKAGDMYLKPDNELTFAKLDSVFLSGNATRDDAPNHVRIQTKVPREIAQTWVSMCPAQVYEIPDEQLENGAAEVDVHVTASNCVQCGAITAKGGPPHPARGRGRAAVPRDLGTSAAGPAGPVADLVPPPAAGAATPPPRGGPPIRRHPPAEASMSGAIASGRARARDSFGCWSFSALQHLDRSAGVGGAGGFASALVAGFADREVGAEPALAGRDGDWGCWGGRWRSSRCCWRR